jgi:hypothetical protein
MSADQIQWQRDLEKALSARIGRAVSASLLPRFAWLPALTETPREPVGS